jgi:hypothetical protein
MVQQCRKKEYEGWVVDTGTVYDWHGTGTPISSKLEGLQVFQAAGMD